MQLQDFIAILEQGKPDDPASAAAMWDERTEESRQKISAWLRANAGPDALVTEASEVLYGRLLWDVRAKVGKRTFTD